MLAPKLPTKAGFSEMVASSKKINSDMVIIKIISFKIIKPLREFKL